MHLQCTYGCNNDCTAGLEAAVSRLDVEELFHANVGAKARLGDDIAFVSSKLKGDLVCNDGAVAVRYVGKRSRMHKHWRLLQGLHECRQNGILHQHCQRSANAQVISRYCQPRFARPYHHTTKPLSHIFKVCAQGQDSHNLTCDGDIKPCPPGMALLCHRLSYSNISQKPIICIDHPSPGYGIWINVQAYKGRNLFRSQFRRVCLSDAKF
mmetsp:Transcript_4516/g.6999  ORF Transcript_4516/g.6999 Transcript_4516/m.6999 type:complete len:210 (+) Transcript_4516:641-1270(+)